MIPVGNAVTLEDILLARESRAAHRHELIAFWKSGLICLTINIPGRVKYSHQACCIHTAGVCALVTALTKHHRQCSYTEIRHLPSGIEGFFVMSAPAEQLKRICCSIEEGHPLGRLFDFDVYLPDGIAFSREQLGLPSRRCLICGGNVLTCRRNAIHTQSEYDIKISEMLEAYERSAI